MTRITRNKGQRELDGSFGLNLTPGDWKVSLSVANTGASQGFSTTANVVPEPGAFGLIAMSGIALLWCRRRRKS